MKTAHLTEEDFRLLLEGEGREDAELCLHHLALCPVCYSIGEFLVNALTSRGMAGATFESDAQA